MMSGQAAMFQVGYFKKHPEIPAELTKECIEFTKKCFEPDPELRPTCDDLLKETFLLRGKKGGLDRPLSNQDSVNGGGGGGGTPLASPYKHRFSRSSESGSHLNAGHFQSGTTTPVSPGDLDREPFHGVE